MMIDSRLSIAAHLLRRLKLKFVSSLAIAASLCAFVPTGFAQSYLFDFGAGANTTGHGAAPDDPIFYWNNISEAIGTSASGQLTNIVSAQNAPSTLGFAIISRFNGANGNGTTLGTNIFPVEATRDSLFGNTETFNGVSNIFPSFKLTGLAPATAYSLTFFASRTGVTDNRETGYTIAGATTNLVALNAANNISNTVSISNIFSTAEGEIVISLAPTPNNNNGMHFTYLGVLKIDAVPPQTPIGFTQEPASQRVVELSDVTFSASVTGAPPHFVQWFSNDVAIPGANQFSYSIPGVTLDMNGSVFSVNVSNLAFSITSSNAVLRVITDTNPPVILAVSTIDGTTIDICFNEALDPNTASEAGNYVINDGGPDFGPSTATLSQDGRCVTLNLGGQAVSGSFTVSLEFISDLSGNPIASGTTVNGSVPEADKQMVLIDFGGTTTERAAPPTDDPIRYWNNVTGAIGQSDAGQLSSLVTTQNLVTSIGLSMISRFNGVNDNGTLSNPAYPTDATRDSLFGNTELFSGLSNIFPAFKLTGLNPSRSYGLTFYASRTGVSDNRETLYLITGAATNTATLNAANNVTNRAVVSGVRPSALGEIAINLMPGPNNNNGMHFTYLGILALTPESGEIRFLAPSLNADQITLQWTGSGELQQAPTVTGPWSTVTPSGVNSHSETVDFETNRFFRIVAP